MSKLDMTAELLLKKVTWEWQPLDPIVDELIPAVAPGVAMRAYENRAKNRKASVPRLSEQEQKRSGARSIIQDRIAAQRNGNRIEVETRSGVRYVRLKERRLSPDATECPTCHRPFERATTAQPQLPSPKAAPRPKVVYPKFPQWTKALDEGSSG